MKICQVHPYRAPAKDSMGAERMLEALTRGLVRAGHEVVMKIHPKSVDTPAPIVEQIPTDVDIVHFHQWHPEEHAQSVLEVPWVSTLHGGGGGESQAWKDATRNNPHVICVSEFIADLVGGLAHVWTCSDPADFTYEAEKDDYFLWCAGTDWGEGKGLFSTIQMAKALRIKLIVAGTGQNRANIEKVESMCDDKVKYVGAVNGEEKAELFSKARAFILLTQLNDACPLTVSEALLSGTPIIASSKGAMPELVSKDVGFIVKDRSEFAQAILKIRQIKPEDCYERGLQHFSSDAIATKYVQLYENMIESGSVRG